MPLAPVTREAALTAREPRRRSRRLRLAISGSVLIHLVVLAALLVSFRRQAVPELLPPPSPVTMVFESGRKSGPTVPHPTEEATPSEPAAEGAAAPTPPPEAPPPVKTPPTTEAPRPVPQQATPEPAEVPPPVPQTTVPKPAETTSPAPQMTVRKPEVPPPVPQMTVPKPAETSPQKMPPAAEAPPVMPPVTEPVPPLTNEPTTTPVPPPPPSPTPEQPPQVTIPPPHPPEVPPLTVPPLPPLTVPPLPPLTVPPLAPLAVPPLAPLAVPPLPGPPPPKVVAKPRAPSAFPPPMNYTFGTPIQPLGQPAARPRPRGSIDLSLGPAAKGDLNITPLGQHAHDAAVADWANALHQWAVEHSYYPREAVREEQEGDSTVHVVMLPNGKVTSVELIGRSGSVWLDMALVSLFRDQRLPRLPPGETQPFDFDFTIHYILRRVPQ